MKEQEDFSIPRQERGWVKVVERGFTVFGILVASLGVIFSTYKALQEPAVSLTATYQESQFSFPEKLSNTKYIDSILISRDRLITQLREQLRKRISDKEWLSIPDSLRFRLPEPFLTREPLDGFVGAHRFFYTLSIKNEGDKSINEIHIIHASDAHYEFRDSKGVLRNGESAGNLPIDDLAATEVREVRLWSYTELIPYNKNLVVTFHDGKVQAKPITLHGEPMVNVEPTSILWARYALYISLAIIFLISIKILKTIPTKRN
jgi:hypothetical protein